MTGFWRPPYATDFLLARGSSGGGTTTQTSQVTLPDWLNKASQNVISTSQDVADRAYQANPYTQVAAVTPQQQQAWGQVSDLQGSTDPAFDASESTAAGLLNQAHPITTDQINSMTASLMNPYTLATVDPTVTQMRQSLGQSMAAEGAKAAGQGAYGGSRQGIQEGTLQSQEALGEGQLVGGLLQSGYNTAQQAATGIANTNLGLGQWATTTLPQLATQQEQNRITETGLLDKAGTEQQGQAQAQLDEAAQNWQTQWDYPYQQLATLESAVGSVPYGSTTTQTGTTTGAGTNVLGSIFGGLATGASLLSSAKTLGLL